jgi:hypothetical protein
MTERAQNRIGKIRLITIGLFFCFVLGGIFYPQLNSKTFGSNYELTPTPTAKPTPPPAKQITPTKAQMTAKSTEFPHGVRQHSKLACNSCHKFPSANWKRVRDAKEAFPDITDYPKHESCLNCHRQQFFGSAKPTVCSICHTNPGPRDSSRHAFPNPREIFDKTAKGKQHTSDFAISFPHDKHIEIVSRNEKQDELIINASFAANRKKAAGEESCSVCHQTYQTQGDSPDEYVTKPPAKLGDAFWLKKGTFKTVPISHATCFTCHSQDAGILPAPTNCATCHKLAPKQPATDFDAKFAATVGGLDKITLTSWRKRDSSATFRHEFSSHADQECANCHNAATINTTNFLTKKVSITSCNLCHITETSDDGGTLNYEVDSRKKDANFACVKCHIAFGKRAIPESHLKAIADAAAGK